MSRKKNYEQFLDKAIDASLAAIDAYNRPFSVYKTETFAILMTNAWELLLKARWIYKNGNKKKSIYVKEKDGRKYKKNSSGNYLTVGLRHLLNKLRQKGNSEIPNNVYNNIIALIEIRDSAVHFKISPATESIAYQIFTASAHNFYLLARKWFGEYKNLRRLENITINPLSIMVHDGVKFVNSSEEKLYKYLKRIIELQEDNDNGLWIAAELKIELIKSKGDADISVKYDPTDPNAIPLKLSEDEWLRRYPWTYKELVKRLKKRYTDFKVNNHFYDLKRRIEPDPENCNPHACYNKYCRIRFLDPRNPKKSNRKKYYSPNVLEYFDKYYTPKEKDESKN